MNDWRDGRSATVAFLVIIALVWMPKPWISASGNLLVDAVLIPLGILLVWPAFRRISTPMD